MTNLRWLKTLKRILTPLVLLSVLLSSHLSSAEAADKVLFVLTSHDKMGDTDRKTGFWLAELTHPYYVIKDAGYQIDIASPKGGKVPIDPKSINKGDEGNARYFADKGAMAKVANTIKLANINPADYKAVFYAGGHGTMFDLPNNPEVNRITASIYQNNGVVGAVCHGPAAFTDVKLKDGSYLIAGKRFAAFTNIEERLVGLTDEMPFLLQTKLEERGGDHENDFPWSENAVADQRVVTGQNPASAHRVGELIVAELKKL